MPLGFGGQSVLYAGWGSGSAGGTGQVPSRGEGGSDVRGAYCCRVAVDATAKGWRLFRAAGFTLIAATLGVAGHLQAAGADPSLAALVALVLPVAVLGWWLSAGELGAVRLGGGVLGVQLGLHVVLTLPAGQVMPPGSMRAITGTAAMAGMHPGWMLAAHLGPAVLAAWWLRCGERALFTTARVCAAVSRLALSVWCFLLRPGVVASSTCRVRWVSFADHPLHSLVSASCRIDRRGPPVAFAA